MAVLLAHPAWHSSSICRSTSGIETPVFLLIKDEAMGVLSRVYRNNSIRSLSGSANTENTRRIPSMSDKQVRNPFSGSGIMKKCLKSCVGNLRIYIIYHHINIFVWGFHSQRMHADYHSPAQFKGVAECVFLALLSDFAHSINPRFDLVYGYRNKIPILCKYL